ncbi:hypothetical protein [Phaeovulum sp.]|uniref:hypothetical protein n=1 Tax=Phaeovulum sp. TaxID=2934796 RepID=UPI0039E44569
MIGIIRAAIFGFIGLSLIYFLMSVYSRSLARERLEKEWAEDPPEGSGETERDAYIRAGMRDYEKSLRKKLVVLVYIIPALVIGVTIYLVNYQ